MSRGQFADRTILTIAVLGSLIFLNILGLKAYGRLDLTRGKQFTLSSATESTLAGLEDPLTVRAYFTKDLPPPFSANTRYVRDLLEEYYARANGSFRYEFIDPFTAETDEDKETRKDLKRDVFGRSVREATSIERELTHLGIAPVQVRVNEGDKIEVKRAYMGIALSYRGQREVIPVVQSTAGLEYDLTTLIRRLTRENRPKVALVTGHDNPDLRRELGRALGLLRQLYDVALLDLTVDAAIPDDVDAVLVLGPRTAASEDELRALDAFIVQGGSAAFLLDSMKADLETLEHENVEHGLGGLLESYGVEIKPGLVLDTECATLTVARQQGFIRIQEPVRYPFIAQPRSLDPDLPLTRGLTQVVFPFMSPLDVTAPEGGGVEAQVLVRSSAQSWVQQPPYDLNPFQRWTRDSADKQGMRNLVVSLTGVMPSHFAQSSEGLNVEDARIIVAGGSGFMTDTFLAQGNEALVLNLMDWLVRDDALLAVRSRGLEAAPLAEVKESRRRTIKYANIIGLPLFCIVFGLIRWRRRESRRSQVSI